MVFAIPNEALPLDGGGLGGGDVGALGAGSNLKVANERHLAMADAAMEWRGDSGTITPSQPSPIKGEGFRDVWHGRAV